MTNYVQRPQINYFNQLKYSDKQLEQQNKLIRNQAASLDLGNPHFKLDLSNYGGKKDLTPKDKYLYWVADWKKTYALLSETIRQLKYQRKKVNTVAVATLLMQVNPQLSNMGEVELHEWNLQRCLSMLPSLKVAAQVMLNARYNAKLASAELRRRALAAKPPAQQTEMAIAAG